MPTSVAALRQQLSDIEPNEETYAGIDRDDVAALRELLDDEEAWIAARAVHALSRIDAADAREALLQATGDSRAEVRTAAASASSLLPPAVSDAALAVLLTDEDIGVRKVAITSVSERNSAPVRQQVLDMAVREPNPRLSQIAESQSAAISGDDQ